MPPAAVDTKEAADTNRVAAMAVGRRGAGRKAAEGGAEREAERARAPKAAVAGVEEGGEERCRGASHQAGSTPDVGLSRHATPPQLPSVVNRV